MPSDYQLLDAGDGRRLERFGDRLVDRPAATAWTPRSHAAPWSDVDLRFDRDTGWLGAMDPWRIDFEGLTLELTETAELGSSGPALDMLNALRDLGVTIAIDDYGTGLSTLEYLKKIPASEIKIDQSFVKSMLENRSDLVMVQSTIALAHSLGRKVVAEGVEHRNVLDALIDMGCDVAQGYVIGRPMSIDSLTKRISTERRSSVG